MEEDTRELIVVDAANVVGSMPNGWWRDRAGATRRFLAQLAEAAGRLEPAAIVVVVEGAAKPAAVGEFDGLTTVSAAGSGDDTIVSVVAAAAEPSPDRRITVVTADRGLRARVEALGAHTTGPRWLLDRMR